MNSIAKFFDKKVEESPEEDSEPEIIIEDEEIDEEEVNNEIKDSIIHLSEDEKEFLEWLIKMKNMQNEDMDEDSRIQFLMDLDSWFKDENHAAKIQRKIKS